MSDFKPDLYIVFALAVGITVALIMVSVGVWLLYRAFRQNKGGRV